MVIEPDFGSLGRILASFLLFNDFFLEHLLIHNGKVSSHFRVLRGNRAVLISIPHLLVLYKDLRFLSVQNFNFLVFVAIGALIL